ncbi:Endoplasmic reticulum aminopeptidase 2 [Papilio xuthus]|uniref:Aminopeptidase n=1 Tax=Papilio xuthus TaxID=66420 RepID=A0A194QIT7_PAPXU|nr:Endoplasmic reticulum aminopeptidase 2 [Papilio xuthus]
MLWRVYILTLCVLTTSTSQPDEVAPHIIKTRSIDLSNAHSLAMETRLEKSVLPTGYNLSLEPRIEDAVYEGYVAINLTWASETDEITLHVSPEVEIMNTTVKIWLEDSMEFRELRIKDIDPDTKKSTILFQVERMLPTDTKGVIEMTFKGKMETTTSEGFFKSTYKTEQDRERTVVATQLRPNNARRVFPCFDEPEFKAPFDVSVVRPWNMVALSNMETDRIENITGEPDAVRVFFKRSPPMSTFTLGLVIADIDKLCNFTNFDDGSSNITIQFWGREGYMEVLNEALFKINYIMNVITRYDWPALPISKLDIVALPNYQGVKPADNWGLIVFKESDLNNEGYIQLAQEVMHQWLGGLVTPAWWSDAHINKALVGYLAVEAAFMINGGCEMDGKWPMTVLYSLYYEYSKRYPHSRITGMKQETMSTKIELLFRMFNYTLGENVFRSGVRKFLNERAYKTFDSDFLWHCLNAEYAISTREHQIDVKTIAQSWIEKDRLPLLTVKRFYNNRTAIVKQKLYLRERPHDVPDAEQMLWWIPLIVSRGDENYYFPNLLTWMRGPQDEIEHAPNDDIFLVVNPEEIAPCPVNYDQHNWYLISNSLQHDKRELLAPLSRAKVLHDAWNLAFAGELSFATALNMTLFLKREKHHIVWDPVFTMIDHIARHVWDIRDKFNAYIISLLRPMYEELEKKKEAEELKNSQKNLRAHLKTFLCQAGYEPCIQEAQEQYRKWMNAPNPDEGNPVSDRYFCPVFRWGTQEEWEFGLQRVINFPHSRKQSERTYLLKTLAGCLRDKTKIMRLLNITLLEGNGNFTEMDLFLINNMFANSPQAYTTLLQFISDHWDVIRERYNTKSNLWSHLISTATSHFTTESGLELVRSLHTAHKGEFGPAEHIVEKSIKNIKEESQWSAQNLPVMEKWLDDYLRVAVCGSKIVQSDDNCPPAPAEVLKN